MQTPRTKPVVSVGLPVFNGEAHLARMLASLLDQTLRDLEVIVSDNASTDGTRAICEELSRRDPRVRYIRQPFNIGAPRNWNVVVNEARGEFFKWSSASDIVPPQALAHCVDTLRSDPGVVLCFGRTRFIDEHENLLEETTDSDIEVSDELPSARFERVCSGLRQNNAQCGVYRLDVLRRTRLDRMYPSGDLALMEELALYGKFRLLPEVLLLRRKSRSSFTAMLSPLELQRIYDPAAVRPMKLIRTRRHLDKARSIWRAPISSMEKLRAYKFAARFTWWDRAALRSEWLSLFRGVGRAS